MSTLDLLSPILAQDDPIVAPTQSTEQQADPAGESADGSTTPAASPFGGSSFLFILLGLFVVMIVFSLRGNRKEKKRRESMLGALKKHDTVQTIGGVIGAIVEVKPDSVVLKVDESSNTRIRFARSAIQQVLTASEKAAPSEEL